MSSVQFLLSQYTVAVTHGVFLQVLKMELDVLIKGNKFCCVICLHCFFNALLK